MIRNTRNIKISSFSSINSSNQSLQCKNRRCECCPYSGKHRDYNRESRLKRQSASSKRLQLTTRQSVPFVLQEKKLNFQTERLMINSKANEVKVTDYSSHKNLSSIIQLSQIYEQQNKRDKNSSKKTLQRNENIDYMKEESSHRKKQYPKNRIQVRLDGKLYETNFESIERMRLALGQLKLLIEKEQKNKQNQSSNLLR